MEETTTKEINLKTIVTKTWANKRLFVKTIPAAIVISSLIIICVPRYYTTDLKLVPELETTDMGGALGSLASSFGFDLGSMQGTDAISPLLYPDLMDDNQFAYNIGTIKVTSEDKSINTTYWEYLKKHQKAPWWGIVKNAILNLLPSDDDMAATNGGAAKFDPYSVSKKANDLLESIRSNVSISVDKKTAVISISVNAQDKLICKTMADSIKSKLQDYITAYRTNKSRIDYKYYKNLVQEAHDDYRKARQLYASYSDANVDVSLKSFSAKVDELENEMQLKYNTYSTLCAQMQAAKAKIQEKTPAFTLIKGASMPVKASGPKRVIFVFTIMLLTFMCDVVYILKDNILDIFKK